MGQLEELRQEREAKTVAYTQFLTEYKKNKKEIAFGFVEGKDDPSLYRTFIEKIIPCECQINLYVCGNKESVKYTYSLFDWRSNSKNRIIFFMDRDLSDVLEDENIIMEKNVYITDYYSIENSIVCSGTLNSLLRDVLGFSQTDQTEIDYIITLFEQQKDIFENVMKPIMAHIIYWKREHILPANYNNIKVKKILSIKNGEIKLKKTSEEIQTLIYDQSQVKIDQYNEDEVNRIIEEISKDQLYKKIVRGKYLSTFFLEFCNSISNDSKNISITKTHKGCLLGEDDMFKTAAPRCKNIVSLGFFINNTIIKYINSIHAV